MLQEIVVLRQSSSLAKTVLEHMAGCLGKAKTERIQGVLGQLGVVGEFAESLSVLSVFREWLFVHGNPSEALSAVLVNAVGFLLTHGEAPPNDMASLFHQFKKLKTARMIANAFPGFVAFLRKEASRLSDVVRLEMCDLFCEHVWQPSLEFESRRCLLAVVQSHPAFCLGHLAKVHLSCATLRFLIDGLDLSPTEQHFVTFLIRPHLNASSKVEVAGLLLSMLRAGLEDDLVEWVFQNADACEPILFSKDFSKHLILSGTSHEIVCAAVLNAKQSFGMNFDFSLRTFVQLLLRSVQERSILKLLEVMLDVPPLSDLLSDNREIFFAAFSHMMLTLPFPRNQVIEELVVHIDELEAGSLLKWFGIESLRLLDHDFALKKYGVPEKAPDVEVDRVGVPEQSEEAYAHAISILH